MTTKEQELFSNVYVPAFRQKCAERGITFPDEQTLGNALDTTKALLEQAQAQQTELLNAAAAGLRDSK